MLQKVTMQGLRLKKPLYIAENANDVRLALQNGLPFIRWRWGKEKFLRQLLRPAAEKLFPGALLSKELGKKVPIKSKVIICKGFVDEEEHLIAEYDADRMLEHQHAYDNIVDDLPHNWAETEEGMFTREVPVAEERRDICGDNSFLGYGAMIEDGLKVEDYFGDLSSSVDISVLQKLRLLPKFVGDIADCIRFNIGSNMYWTEGYTKKLGVPLGNFKSKAELPNLIIIDISASIPDGIAATMLTLADTLRSQCNAELIITSARSGYYPIGAELPKPQTLRDYYGRNNEGAEFMAIINKYIAGREFGHVISFGDNDNPGWAYQWRNCDNGFKLDLANTKVHAVHHYHTSRKEETGYGKWTNDCSPDEITYDTSWCNMMNKKYKM